MSDLNPTSRLPERQIPDAQVDAYRDFYIELLGFVPPRIQARTELLARLDPELLEMQEAMRRKCMYPSCFDTKTSQLMLFGMLLITLRDAANPLEVTDVGRPVETEFLLEIGDGLRRGALTQDILCIAARQKLERRENDY